MVNVSLKNAGLLKFYFQKFKMADGCRLKNRKIATSRDDAEWVTRTHRLSDILDFQKN